jgi:DNA-binding winged helix-turn-helix (wHTH) protein/TolB-like protein/Tfp pilus assembly protein PilF
MQELSETKVYEFDDFRLKAKSHRLFRRESGELVPLTPKAVELLIFLIQNKGRVLTKDELLDTIWADTIVEESNLSQTIFVLRKTLGENTKKPRFILTVPNRGYQFIAEVRETSAEDKILEDEFLTEIQTRETLDRDSEIRNPKSSRYFWLAVPLVLLLTFGIYRFYPAAKPASVSEIRSIAVLPFEDSGAEQADKYFGVNLAEALANKFSNLKQITVAPTRSVSKYADSREDPGKIGRELQVDAVLDGRIQHDGLRIRVSVQLIRTADNVTFWTENFDEDFTNFFAVQDSISQKVVKSLALKLNEKEREKFNRRGTENAVAYQEYLLGRFFWNKRSADDLNRALEHFNRAVELDANFAEAYAGLADTYAIYPFYAVVEDNEALPKARAAATRALEIDGELAEAYTSLAYVQSQYDFDWKGAEKSYLRAIELNPNQPTTRQWYGEFLAFQNRTDESLEQMQKAIELDPTSLSTNTAPALPYLISHQYEKALETIDKVLQMNPNFLIAQHYKVRALFRLGREKEAFDIYRKTVADSNGSIWFKADLGCLYGRAGNEKEARKILDELTGTAKSKRVSPFYFATLYFGLNEREKAFAYLRQAVAEHDNNVITLATSGNFEAVRSDPQFIEIMRSANF